MTLNTINTDKVNGQNISSTFIVLLFSRPVPNHLKGLVLLPLVLVSVVGPREEQPVEAHPGKEPGLVRNSIAIMIDRIYFG